MGKQYLADEAIQELKKLQKTYDTEANHVEADEILCELLKELGFEDVVEQYNKIKKWYS